ncbi:MAG TPA: alpha/beta fold hydrolase [Deltaproteobacteria bacterium]|nr:alpha/beta fold hydrolase [Deltaproteobacteria bacterium]
MPYENLSFNSVSGEKLSARLDFPESDPVAYALFAHCFTCTKNFKAVDNISRSLADEGIAVFRFDFTGLGESEGDFAETSFSSNVDDLIAATRFMDAHYESPAVLIGHSLGGAAIIQAASKIPSAVAVATIGAPADPGHLTHLNEYKQQIEIEGEAEVSIAGRRFKIRRQFLEDLEDTNMEAAIRNLNRALIIFHSPLDDVVGVENAAKIFQTARHPKSFISLDRADHLLSERRDSRYVGALIATWASRYLRI